MKIKLPARDRRVRAIRFAFKSLLTQVRVWVSPITGSLFFTGSIGSDPVLGFVHRHGGQVAVSDALGRNDRALFIDALVGAAKYKRGK